MAFGIAPPQRRESIRLRDGRVLAWAEWGAPGGLPVLFCTGAAMSGSVGFGTGDLAHLGMRLLAPDRPGLGWSDPHPEKTLHSWLDDIRQMIHILDLRGAGAVGFSQGAPFALMLAAHGAAQAVAIVSGQDELAHPRMLPLLPADIASFVNTVRQDPEGFAAGFSQTASTERLLQLVIEMSSDHDRAVYLSPEFDAAYRQCVQEGFCEGAEAYVRDLVNSILPWPFQVEEIAVPVDLWYGRMDTSPVHSPDFGSTLAGRLRHSSLIIDPDQGGSILWTRARDILAALKRHLTQPITSAGSRPER